MKHAHRTSEGLGPRGKATNATVRAELVAEAARGAARWRAENQKALEEYARFFEQHGIWNEGCRGW